MSKIGDLTLDILLNITEAEKGAKKITASLKNVEGVTNKVIQSSSDLTGKMGKLGFALSAVRDAGQILGSSLSTIFNTIRASNDAYQQFLSSNRQLEATSKLTGANLKDLNEISKQTKDQFSLTAGQSNLFTIELTKLGQKAGDVTKVQQSINALMDLGAGQGLDAEQTLYAIKQAILGIDEGTDKLFQKNPSVLYDEFAKKIGTTAGKLTDQQKAQALLDAVMKNGSILNGQYSSYLETAAGKQQKLNGQIQDAKIKLGEQLQPVLLSFLTHVNNLISFFGSLSPSTQKWIVILGTMSVTVGKLIPLIVTFKDTFGSLGASILKLGKDAPGAFGKVEKAGISTFGKGGLLFAALVVTLDLIDDILDNIDKAAKEKTELMNRPTPLPNVPPGYKSEDGVLKKDESAPTMDWDLYKKNTIQAQEETKKLTETVKETNKEIAKTDGAVSIDNSETKGGKSPASKISEVKDFVTTLESLEKSLAELQYRISNQTEGENVELFGTKKELEDKIKLIKEINAIGYDAYIRQQQQKELEGITVEKRRIGPVFGHETFKEIEDAQSRNVPEAEDKKSSVADKINSSLSLATQIKGILGLGADNFVSKLLGGLQQGTGLASSIAKLLSLFGSGGTTGIFSLLGFASGGSVPGAGSGDTVPAMLTPGEFVINKSRASQLGGNFLNWLNGGGTVQNMAPGAFMQQVSSGKQTVEVPYIVSHKVTGNDLKTILTRVEKTTGRRTL